MRAVINFQLYRDNKTIPVQYYFENPVRVDKIYTQSDMEEALNYAERCGQYVVTAISYEAAKLFDPLLKVHEVKGPLAIFITLRDLPQFRIRIQKYWRNGSNSSNQKMR